MICQFEMILPSISELAIFITILCCSYLYVWHFILNNMSPQFECDIDKVVWYSQPMIMIGIGQNKIILYNLTDTAAYQKKKSV